MSLHSKPDTFKLHTSPKREHHLTVLLQEQGTTMCVVLSIPASYGPREAIKANIQAAGRHHKSRFQSNQNRVCGDGYRNLGNPEETADHLLIFFSFPHTKPWASAVRILAVSRQGWWLEGTEKHRQELKHQKEREGGENELENGIRRITHFTSILPTLPGASHLPTKINPFGFFTLQWSVVSEVER